MAPPRCSQLCLPLCGRLAQRSQRFTLLSLEVKLRGSNLPSSQISASGDIAPRFSADPWHHPPMAETPSNNWNASRLLLPLPGTSNLWGSYFCDNSEILVFLFRAPSYLVSPTLFWPISRGLIPLSCPGPSSNEGQAWHPWFPLFWARKEVDCDFVSAWVGSRQTSSLAQIKRYLLLGTSDVVGRC